MDPVRWRAIENLCQQALEKEADQRGAFLREACAGDDSLREEVEALLAQLSKAENFIESPALEVAAKVLARSRESTANSDLTGQSLSHYRVLGKIGSGGMGLVYRAHDEHLGRDVAIKVLPDVFATDPERLARLDREARLMATVSHPNVAAIHGIEAAAGKHFLVLELVEGETLTQFVDNHKLSPPETLKYAIQISDALAKAHKAGIVHRDLKPSNIVVTQDGLVKILDFGLAKLTHTAPEETLGVGRSSVSITGSGILVGTVAYMSPEQAEGKEVDGRSDIFSFGSVLYEMVTGRRAFIGDSNVSTLAAVLKEDPKAPSEVVPGVPQALEKIIHRCLLKDPVDRWQHAGDIKAELEELMRQIDLRPALPGAKTKTRRGLRLLMAALTSALILTGALWLLISRVARELPPAKLINLTSYPGSEYAPSFSPDGNQVAFSWNGEKSDNWDTYVKLVGDPNALRLTTNPSNDLWPAWSPDGKRIAFGRAVSPNSGTVYLASPFNPNSGTVYLVSPLGGPEQKLTDFPVNGPMSWSPDGKWLAVSRPRASTGTTDDTAGIYLLPVLEGEPKRITYPTAPVVDISPSFSPDGRSLAYRASWSEARADLYIQSLNVDYAPQGKPRRIQQASFVGTGFAWTSDSKSVVYSGQLSTGLAYLYRVPINGKGPPQRVELAGRSAFHPNISAAKNRLAFRRWLIDADIWRYPINGTAEPVIASSFFWDISPKFSPDGKRIAFASARNGESLEIWIAHSDGSRPAQLTNHVGRSQGSPSWSPDGLWVAFDSQRDDGQFDIFAIDSNGGRPRQITSEQSNEYMPTWSRDGKWIYFQSDRTGRGEIWRIPANGGPTEQMTANGGNLALESIDGKTLFYSKMNGGLFAKPLIGGQDRQLIDRIAWGFAPTAQGIYYFGRVAQDGRSPLLFYEFSSRVSRLLTTIGGIWRGEITVSPDGKTLLFVDSPNQGNDLMLIENFR